MGKTGTSRLTSGGLIKSLLEIGRPDMYVLWFRQPVSKRRLFTALHVMQTRYCDENSVRLSVCPSVRLSHACIVTKR